MSVNTVAWAGGLIASKSIFSYIWSLRLRVQNNQETTLTDEAVAWVTNWSCAIHIILPLALHVCKQYLPGSCATSMRELQLAAEEEM